jgi:hypothetical protein
MGQTASRGRHRPGRDLLVDVAGDVGDQRSRGFHAVELPEDVLDVACGHPLGIKGQNLLVEAFDSPLVFGYELGLKCRVLIVWNLRLELAHFALDSLVGMTVTTIATLGRGGGTRRRNLIANGLIRWVWICTTSASEAVIHLGVEHPLQRPRHH